MTEQPKREPVLWLNGDYRNVNEACISPLDRGFQYGDGLFETIRADQGIPLYLDQHMERLLASARELNLTAKDLSGIDWQRILCDLLRINKLDEHTARIKIVITRGIESSLGLPSPVRPTILALTAPYSPPSPEEYEKGWQAIVYRNGCAPFTASHKSLNYLYFLMAKEDALKQGAKEAIVLDRNGRVSEGATSSLLLYRSNSWYVPLSENQLPGITLKQAERLMQRAGRPVKLTAVSPDDLLSFEGIWALNSMIGIVALTEIDNQPIQQCHPDTISRLRLDLLAGRSPLNR